MSLFMLATIFVIFVLPTIVCISACFLPHSRLDRYTSIERGMSEYEVIRIMGKKFTKSLLRDNVTKYEWTDNSFTDKVTVYFKDDVVEEVIPNILPTKVKEKSDNETSIKNTFWAIILFFISMFIIGKYILHISSLQDIQNGLTNTTINSTSSSENISYTQEDNYDNKDATNIEKCIFEDQKISIHDDKDNWYICTIAYSVAFKNTTQEFDIYQNSTLIKSEVISVVSCYSPDDINLNKAKITEEISEKLKDLYPYNFVDFSFIDIWIEKE